MRVRGGGGGGGVRSPGGLSQESGLRHEARGRGLFMRGEGGRAQRYVDVQTVQDHVDACFQASLAGIDLAKCRKPGVRAEVGETRAGI